MLRFSRQQSAIIQVLLRLSAPQWPITMQWDTHRATNRKTCLRPPRGPLTRNVNRCRGDLPLKSQCAFAQGPAPLRPPRGQLPPNSGAQGGTFLEGSVAKGAPLAGLSSSLSASSVWLRPFSRKTAVCGYRSARRTARLASVLLEDLCKAPSLML